MVEALKRLSRGEVGLPDGRKDHRSSSVSNMPETVSRAEMSRKKEMHLRKKMSVAAVVPRVSVLRCRPHIPQLHLLLRSLLKGSLFVSHSYFLTTLNAPA